MQAAANSTPVMLPYLCSAFVHHLLMISAFHKLRSTGPGKEEDALLTDTAAAAAAAALTAAVLHRCCQRLQILV
jgi:hypothetical protein